MRRRLLILALVFSAILGVVAASLSACCVRPRDPSRVASQRAPEFELPDAAGATVALDELLNDNRYAVVVFYRGHW